MKNAKISHTIVHCVLCGVATTSFAQDSARPPESTAQSVPTLPKSFKGELISTNSAFQQLSNVVELQITNQGADGKITGAYSRAVRYTSSKENLCVKADNLPAEGTYDGEKLVLKVKGSQNSNPPLTCDDYTITFVRGKEHYFERKLSSGSSYLDPVK